MHRLISSVLLLAVSILTWVQPALAENRILGLRTGIFEDSSRLVIETSENVPVSLFLLSKPWRLVVDLPASSWQVEGQDKSGSLQTAPLKGYRYGDHQSAGSRLVIDLNAPAIPIRAFRLPPLDTGQRLVIDLRDQGETAFHIAARALLAARGKPLEVEQRAQEPVQPAILKPVPKPSGTDAGVAQSELAAILKPLPKPPLPQSGKSASGLLLPLPKPGFLRDKPAADRAAQPRKWVVFIDAGHGGKDPGAISPSGIKEKTITLKAAHELAQQLNATGRIKAVLSRHDDRYHRLRKRISLAREERADIFISLHADAAPNRQAMGVSVFTLSEMASDKEAALLAAKENKADLIGGPDLGTTDEAVTTVLLGMFQRESMNQSSVLAAEMNKAFEGLPTPRRGHRFAGFAVLKSPDVPSVLIEMGFLTNRKDERNLQSQKYMNDLMKRITRAVLTYFENTDISAPQNLP
ncbi:MAG: N-acetylmuramoyl-L-alanine amidase [Parvularculales bacterium]